MDWFRWYHGTVDDEKLDLIAADAGAKLCEVVAVWAKILEKASEGGERGTFGEINCRAIDRRLGMDDGTADRILAAMVRERILTSAGEVVNWSKRQPKREDTTAAKRMQEYRARKAERDASGDDQLRGVTQSSHRGEEKRREESSIKPPPTPPSQPPAKQETLPAVSSRGVPAPSARGVSRETWLTWFDEQWPVGKLPFGQAGKVFKALIAEHGEEKVKAGWAAYCREMQRQPQFFSLAKFSTTFGSWASAGPGGRRSSQAIEEMAKAGWFDNDEAEGWR